MKIKQYEKKKKIILSDLMEARVYLGLSKSIWDPTIVSYLFGIRNGFCVFNLEHTLICLKKAIRVIYRVNHSNKQIIFVGFPDSEKSKLTKIYSNTDHLYISNQSWINGILTDGKDIKLYIHNFLTNLKLKKKKESDLFYEKFGGILNLKKKPSLIVIYDHSKNLDALKEASKMGIPIISFVNSEGSTKQSDYPITGNFSSKLAGGLYKKILKHSLN